MLNKLLELQHHSNPLHLYCRLVGRDYCKDKSLKVCKYYEIIFYRFINVLLGFLIKILKDERGGSNG